MLYSKKLFTLVPFVLAITLCCHITVAQNNTIDSLHQLLSKSKQDTNRVNLLNYLAQEQTSVSNYDTGILLCKSALKLSTTLNFTAGIAEAYGNLGTVYYYQADYPKTLANWTQALKINEQLKTPYGIAKWQGNIGSVYKAQENYSKALEYYLKALNSFEKIGDNYNLGAFLGNIGTVYFLQNDYSKALDYYLQALKIKQKVGDKSGEAIWLGNIGQIYKELNEYDKALMYYLKALKIDEELGDKIGISSDLGNIGTLYSELKKYNEAEKYLLRAVEIDKEIGAMDYQMIFEKELCVLYSNMGKYKKALEHYQNAMIVKDSMYNQEKTVELTSIAMNYEFEKKEAETKAKQDIKDAIIEEESQTQQVIIISVSIGLILVVLLAFFIFLGYRQKQKANVIITKQKEEVEHQKLLIEEHRQDIIDSINYAQRIQDAILPAISTIQRYFPTSFVLYKPKDIVAGDFYWMEKVEDNIFIAAADCTGHGVPGAMVSVVCSNALNQTVKEFGLKQTGKILDKVSEIVAETFRKSNSEVKDGMDISLLSFDMMTHQIQWSGANNSLIYFNGNTLNIVKAEKQHIGNLEHSKPFQTHTIPYSSDLMFYLITDGFSDQFGGPKGKKFMYRQFEQCLSTIFAWSMKKQHAFLEKQFQDWQGDLEQVDDVTVIGIKI